MTDRQTVVAWFIDVLGLSAIVTLSALLLDGEGIARSALIGLLVGVAAATTLAKRERRSVGRRLVAKFSGEPKPLAEDTSAG